MKNDEWWMMIDGWMRKDEGWRMTDEISSCFGYRWTDPAIDICDFATDKNWHLNEEKLQKYDKLDVQRTWSIVAHPPYFLDFLVLNWWIWLKFGAKSCKFRRLLWKNKEKIHLEIFYPLSRSFFGNMIDESVCLQTQYSDLYFMCTAWIRYWLTIYS